MRRLREQRLQRLSDRLDGLKESLLGIDPGMWPTTWQLIRNDFLVLRKREAKLERKLSRR